MPCSSSSTEMSCSQTSCSICGPWSSPRMVRTVSASSWPGLGRPGVLREHLHIGSGRVGSRPHHQLDDARPGTGRRVEHVRGPGRPAIGPGTGRPGRPVRWRWSGPRRNGGGRRRPPRPPSRRRWSRGPSCAPPPSRPGPAGAAARPTARLEQGGQRLGPALQLPGGQLPQALDVDPVGGHPHQHVGPEARPELPLPALQPLGRAPWPDSGGGR